MKKVDNETGTCNCQMRLSNVLFDEKFIYRMVICTMITDFLFIQAIMSAHYGLFQSGSLCIFVC